MKACVPKHEMKKMKRETRSKGYRDKKQCWVSDMGYRVLSYPMTQGLIGMTDNVDRKNGHYPSLSMAWSDKNRKIFLNLPP